jgi:hypothetical protein
MKILVSDKIFDKNNITGYNWILLNELLTNNNTECVLFFIENVTQKYNIYDYLNEKNKYKYEFWCETLNYLSHYKIEVISKELLENELKNINLSSNANIHYFCEKRNISYLKNEEHNAQDNIQKYLYLSDYDIIDDNDKLYFSKIYTFNNIHVDCDKVEFIQFDIKRHDILTLFNHEKKNLRLNMKDDSIVIFIHLYDDLFYDTLDRIILAIHELKKTNKIHTVFYWPLEKCVNKTITSATDIVVYDDKIIYKYYDIDIPIDKEIFKNNYHETLNIKFSIVMEHSLTIKEFIFNIVNHYIKDDYTMINVEDDYNLLKNIYNSDIYIPVTDNLSYLTLLSQYYKTYTIFTNDSNNTQEYCIYGNIPLLESNDYIYCPFTNRIKRNMKMDDMKNAIENYIENKDNSFFLYKREFCEYLFG